MAINRQTFHTSSFMDWDVLVKFSELIVQECSQACLDEAEKFSGEQDITDFKICALVIKERFGVE